MGDIIFVTAGSYIDIDGLVINDGYLEVDESSLTGISEI